MIPCRAVSHLGLDFVLSRLGVFHSTVRAEPIISTVVLSCHCRPPKLRCCTFIVFVPLHSAPYHPQARIMCGVDAGDAEKSGHIARVIEGFMNNATAIVCDKGSPNMDMYKALFAAGKKKHIFSSGCSPPKPPLRALYPRTCPSAQLGLRNSPPCNR